MNPPLEPRQASVRLIIPGPVAQLGERLVRNEEVVSSILIGSTKFLLCGGLRAAVLMCGTTSPISMSVVIPLNKAALCGLVAAVARCAAHAVA